MASNSGSCDWQGRSGGWNSQGAASVGGSSSDAWDHVRPDPVDWPSTCTSCSWPAAGAEENAEEEETIAVSVTPQATGEGSSRVRTGRWQRRLQQRAPPQTAAVAARHRQRPQPLARDPQPLPNWVPPPLPLTGRVPPPLPHPPPTEGPPPPPSFPPHPPLTMDVLGKWMAVRCSALGHWKQHNAALKWFRLEMCKKLETDPQACQIDVLPNDAVPVPTLVHDTKGTGFRFDMSEMRLWDWRDMLFQLSDESRRWVIEGTEGCSSGGVTRCEFSMRRYSYAHLQHLIALENDAPIEERMPEYDFVLHRGNGTAIRLHPQWSNTKFSCYALACHASEVPIPRDGLGTSEGPGTVRWYKNLDVQREVKFDATKGPAKTYP